MACQQKFKMSVEAFVPIIAEVGEDDALPWPSSPCEAPRLSSGGSLTATKHLLRILGEVGDTDPIYCALASQLTPEESARISFAASKALANCGWHSDTAGRHKVRRMRIKSGALATDKALSKPYLYRKAASYLYTFLFHLARARMRSAFQSWERAHRVSRRLMARMFHRWNDRVTGRKLSNLKAARFLPLLSALDAAAVQRLQRCAWTLWQVGLQHRHNMRRAKLLLTCWRTATRSCKRGRRIRIRLAFREWHEGAQDALRARRLSLVRHYFTRFCRATVDQRHLLTRVARLGLTLLPLRQALYWWLLVCGHGAAGSVAMLRRAERFTKSLEEDSSMSSCGPRSPHSPAPPPSANVKLTSTPRPRGSTPAADWVGTPNKVDTTQIRKQQQQQQQQRTPIGHSSAPRTGGSIRSNTPSRGNSASACAWERALLNISHLSATKSGGPGTGQQQQELPSSCRYVSSRSLLFSPGRPTPNSQPKGKTRGPRMLQPDVKMLMADPVARLQKRLEGLRQLGDMVIRQPPL